MAKHRSRFTYFRDQQPRISLSHTVFPFPPAFPFTFLMVTRTKKRVTSFRSFLVGRRLTPRTSWVHGEALHRSLRSSRRLISGDWRSIPRRRNVSTLTLLPVHPTLAPSTLSFILHSLPAQPNMFMPWEATTLAIVPRRADMLSYMLRMERKKNFQSANTILRLILTGSVLDILPANLLSYRRTRTAKALALLTLTKERHIC
mmetsp:Transcript_22642/g.65177  ORF Transcript_22642/g.65177 Transcript_22642/m.65177 type:complete len:202 (-) Transcript_22642:209-814(-)